MTEITELRDFRKNGHTLDAMADLFNVNRTTILRWEKGEVPIPIKRLERIAKATGIPREKLRPDIFGVQRSARA